MTLDRLAGRRAVILGLFVAVSLVTRVLFLGVPFLDLDEAAAFVGSRELLRGGALYVDFADNRPPLLYAFYALAQLVLGPGMRAVRLLVVLAVVPLTAFAASAFYRHDRRGLAAGLLYLVYGAAFLAHDMHSVSPELLVLLPLGAASACWCGSRPDPGSPPSPSPCGSPAGATGSRCDSGASPRWASPSPCRSPRPVRSSPPGGPSASSCSGPSSTISATRRTRFP